MFTKIGTIGVGVSNQDKALDFIEATCQTLKARGVTITQELSTEPWGKWAQFTDPDGNEFGIWAPAG